MLKDILLIALICFSLFACSNNPSKSEAYEAVIEMHNNQRTFHFDKMPEEFASQLADNFISLNRGIIDSVSYDEHVERYKTYFSAVDFVKWDDVNPPIFRYSDDNTLVYTIVEKDVILTYPDENGEMLYDSTRYVWTAIYKYAEGEWKIESVSSTNKESVYQD